MSYGYDYALPVAAARPDERAAFMRRTYFHLAGAIGVFAGLEALLFWVVGIQGMVRLTTAMFGNMITQLLVLAMFIGAGYLARYWARNSSSVAMQYMGLGLYIIAEVIIFIPILTIAAIRSDANLIPTAGILTACIFAGLTTAAFVTRKDFSFLAPIISMGFFLMIGLVLIAVIFPQFVSLGMWFSFIGVALACAAILYSTSNVIHHYSLDMHVAAALELFAAVAVLFYYILDLLMRRD